MSINGLLFLFAFLPVCLLVYYLAPGRLKEYVLLIASFGFYALGSYQYILLFLIVTVLTVIIGRSISRVENGRGLRKILLITGIVVNAGILVYYKYTDFALRTFGSLFSTEVQLKGLVLPLGISFFTFKSISYLVDIYQNKAMLDKDPTHDALYLSFFGQVQSGPLSRYNEMKRPEGFSADLFADGVYRFLIGFNKKVLLSNVLSNITTEVYGAGFENFSTAYAWLGAVCYSLQLFYDFAGYSDMAIGLTEMFGYKCGENFCYPYMTESVAKFWRRWHISLSGWFRDYIYIPMGGSRTNAKWKVYFNLLVVWVLTGIWHGASWNFIAWGLGYFFAISFERLTGLPGRLRTKGGRILYRILTLLFINFEWVLFRAPGLKAGLRFLRRMLVCAPNALADQRTLFLLKDYGFFLLAAVIFCFPLVPKLDEITAKHKALSVTFEVVKDVLILGAFVWAVSFVVAGQNNPFAYANF